MRKMDDRMSRLQIFIGLSLHIFMKACWRTYPTYEMAGDCSFRGLNHSVWINDELNLP